MAGHVFLLACLLAICLPIVFVQLPRFAISEDKQAENEAETRSSILPQRPLSPSGKSLRRIERLWSETGVDIEGTETEQEQEQEQEQKQEQKQEPEQGRPEKVAQAIAGRRQHSRICRFAFQGDATADPETPSQETDHSRRASTGRKPWDPPFRR